MKYRFALLLVLLPVAATAATFSKQFTITGTSPPVVVVPTNISLSPLTVQGGPGSSGATVGTWVVTMSDGSTNFTGQMTVQDCATGCVPSTKFSVSGKNVIVNPALGSQGLPPGSYPIQLTATQ